HQRRGLVAALEAHLAGCVGGDDGSDVLSSDRKLHLRKQSFDAHLDNASDQLIAPTDAAETRAPLGGLLAERLEEIAVNLALWNAMMSARGFCGAQLAFHKARLTAI